MMTFETRNVLNTQVKSAFDDRTIRRCRRMNRAARRTRVA